MVPYFAFLGFFGVLPTLGPGRAIFLSVYDMFTRTQPEAPSQRTEEVKRLTGLLSTVKRGEFILLTGEAGSGGCKSTSVLATLP